MREYTHLVGVGAEAEDALQHSAHPFGDGLTIGWAAAGRQWLARRRALPPRAPAARPAGMGSGACVRMTALVADARRSAGGPGLACISWHGCGG